MNYGRLTESVYERSVVKSLKKYSTENKKFYTGAAPKADCAVFSYGSEADIGICVSGQASASSVGLYADDTVAMRAYMAAVNNAVVYSAAAHRGLCISEAFANITVMVSEKLREIKLKNLIEKTAQKAEELKIPIIGCDVQVLPGVTGIVANCVVNAGIDKNSVCYENNINKPYPGEDIVMTKWAGLEGTSIVAKSCFDKLCERYPSDIVNEAADFYKYLSIMPEAALAAKSGAAYKHIFMHIVREGGIFGALWALAADNGVGLVADLKNIPVRQETIEVCEYFDLNPYELISGGSILITCENGARLVRELESENVYAAVIGRITEGNDRLVCHGDEKRFLEPAKGDEIYKYQKERDNERKDIINN